MHSTVLDVGYPTEMAEKLGPTISTMLIGEDQEEFVLQITTASTGRFNERRFRLDEVQESTIKHGPNKVTTCQVRKRQDTLRHFVRT